MNRRSFGLGCIATGIVGAGAKARAGSDPVSRISTLEASLGGRIGVAAFDTGSGRRIAHRADERFAMCSTFKWLLAASILARVGAGHASLGQHIAYTAADLLAHSPITQQHLVKGLMTIGDLCAAAVEESDNGAANLLLHAFGGPEAVTVYARSIGDRLTRLDRTELSLNENLPGDPRDTTTPSASIADLQRVLLGDALKPTQRVLLVSWMKNCRTGLDRLRARLPRDWVIGDKTGTGTGSGSTSAANDIAVAWPPRRSPIVIASYVSGSAAPMSVLAAAHASVGHIVAKAFL